MVSLFLTHLVEIVLFALLYMVFNDLDGFGSLSKVELFSDFFYYSAVCYTTLGFGDIVPEGYLRLITGLEALLRLILITWSATFSYLLMSRRLTS